MTTEPLPDPYRMRITALATMMERQEMLQRAIIGDSPSALSDEDKMRYITEQALAVSAEVHEALNETGHKSWATSNHIKREAYVAELRDALQHLFNLMLVVGVTPQELCTKMMEKQRVNLARIRDGYDGVSTKCPQCHRAYDDPAVKCESEHAEHAQWCAVYGFVKA